MAENPKISFPNKAEQLQHISPSQFSALKSCQLRVVFSLNHIPHCLPISPSARLGTIVHKIIEEAGSHQIHDADFEKLWNTQVKKQEEQMKQSWFECHLIPLEKNALDYEVKKRQCTLILESLKKVPIRDIGSSQIQRECSLKSKDGLIVGRADEIRTEKDGSLTIIDYKTGKIRENPLDFKLSPEYEEQLKLYAALLHEEHNRWPTCLALITIDGKKHDISFDKSECMTLLDQCRKEILSINTIIATDELFVAKANKLSCPSPAKCHYCLYRPICEPYLNARQQSSAKDWPLDIWGEIKEKKILLNGLGKITLATLSNSFSKIRGLKIDRHPALAEFNKIAIFSLQNDGAENNFKEGQFTTIYGI